MDDFFSDMMHHFETPLTNPVLIFSILLFIILLSPIILKWLRMPSIIGLIISGVIIGPHGLNILAHNSAIDLFATIGLLYIMFIAGLELDMNDFKAHRQKSLIFGFYTFIIPLVLGFPVCYYLLNYDFNASFLTASMFATHTLVTYPIVSKMGITKNPAVAITVGGTILTDTAVLIILAVIIGSANGGLTNEFWIRLGISLAIFMAILFLIIPRVAKWFFSHLENEKHSHYIFVLAMVFLAAFLAELAGVEPIIGAFLAGLALNKLIPHSSALMNRIEFIGNSLFIPFFLISVGMLVDISVLTKGPQALIVALTLSATALVGKWLASVATRFSFKFTPAQGNLIFGLSGAHAAATLAVILVGYRANIIDENILNGTILLILITCLVASFVTEKASKRILLEEDGSELDLSLLNSAFNEHILLPIANIDKFENLLEFATLIKEPKSNFPVSILSVVSNNTEAEVNILKAKNKLNEFVKEASASETNVNIITTIDHNVASGINRIAKEVVANFIILGWPRHQSIFQKLFGEKVDNILYNSNKTSFVCYFNQPIALHKRIVIAVPEFAEREEGFVMWLHKVCILSQQLSAPLQFYCNQQTRMAVEKEIKRSKQAVLTNFELFDDWEDFLVIARHINQGDLFILISARRGSVSFLNILENLPIKLEKHFSENSRIIIYPQQNESVDFLTENYEDISAEPLSKGIETIQKIGKTIGNIFKKERD